MRYVNEAKCPHCHSITHNWRLECPICLTRLDVEPGSNIPVLSIRIHRIS
jgi:Zn finger protein HypA/HybF involved in hydrogenase expression